MSCPTLCAAHPSLIRPPCWFCGASAAVAPSPEGRGAGEAHVKLPNELLEKCPAPQGDDIRWLREVADEFNLDQQ